MNTYLHLKQQREDVFGSRYGSTLVDTDPERWLTWSRVIDRTNLHEPCVHPGQAAPATKANAHSQHGSRRLTATHEPTRQVGRGRANLAKSQRSSLRRPETETAYARTDSAWHL